MKLVAPGAVQPPGASRFSTFLRRARVAGAEPAQRAAHARYSEAIARPVRPLGGHEWEFAGQSQDPGNGEASEGGDFTEREDDMPLFSGLLRGARRRAESEAFGRPSENYPSGIAFVPGQHQGFPPRGMSVTGTGGPLPATGQARFGASGQRFVSEPLSSQSRQSGSSKRAASAPRARDPLGLSEIVPLAAKDPVAEMLSAPRDADGRLTPIGKAMCRGAIEEVISWSRASGIANDTPMERRALERYVYGTGRPARLPPGVIDTIDSYVRRFKNAKSEDTDPRPYDPPGSHRSQVDFGKFGGSWSKSVWGDTGPVQFSPELDALLGSATVIFDRKGKAIGVEDDYDYTAGNRGFPVEQGTRLANDLLEERCGAVHPYHLYGGTGR